VRFAFGSDHAGFPLKELLREHLEKSEHAVIDLGTHDETPVDYPDYGAAVGRTVVAGEADLGVCVCGTGIGISIAANKIPGVRAAVVHDVSSARLAKHHNNANVVCFGARLLGDVVATDALDAFIDSTFDGGRHETRIEKIAALDAER
jgi:ribose 5-phosphate isomerase B